MGVMVFSELWGSEEALGVGETPGELGWFPTLSFEVLFGDSLDGKLNVFVHCDKLRTILTVHSQHSFTEPGNVLASDKYVRVVRRFAIE